MNATPSAYIEHHATVADNVRAEVARRRTSQSEIAEALGLHQAGVSRRLAGRTEWTGSELARLAEILQVPVATFFDGRPTMTTPALDASWGIEGGGSSASASATGAGVEDSSERGAA